MDTIFTPKQKVLRRTVGGWLKHPIEWHIPVYQRHYAWETDNEASDFWEVVEKQTIDRINKVHSSTVYFGAIIVNLKNTDIETKTYDVVDGQQRLTTIQLLLLAIVNTARKMHLGDDVEKRLAKYIFIDEARPKSKLNPSNFDKVQFESVLEHAFRRRLDREFSEDVQYNWSKIETTYDFFCKAIKKLMENLKMNEDVINELQETILEGFQLVVIPLEKYDNAQKVYEALNNTSRPLTTFDLIRNDVFYRVAEKYGDEQNSALRDVWSVWKELETPFWEKKSSQQRKKVSEGASTHVETYIARFLVAKLQEEIKFTRNVIVKTYRDKFSKRKEFESIKDEIHALINYVDTYKYLVKETEKNPVAHGFDFGIFRESESKDFYPVLFVIVKSKNEDTEKQKMIRLLESYVIRRSLCKLSASHYNLFAASLCKDLGEHASCRTLYELLMKSEKKTSVFPDDNSVKNGCIAEKFYNSNFQRYILAKIEQHQNDSGSETNIKDDLSVDHILPQSWDKDPRWIDQLLDANNSQENEYKKLQIMNSMHTIGNLTLMSGKRNSKKSNNPFDEVRKLLEDSNLKMNRAIAKEDEWSEKNIVTRSNFLADIIIKLWPRDIL